MNNIIRQMRKDVLNRTIFPFMGSLVFCGILIYKSGNEFNGYLLVLFIGFSMVMLISLFYFIKENREIDKIADRIPSHCRIVDSTVFCDDKVFSLSDHRCYELKYSDIVKVTHHENIFEKVYTHYYGKHKVALLLRDERVIWMNVADSDSADRILCYIRTVSPDCTVYGLIRDQGRVTLDDLSNIDYQLRF